MSSIAHEIARGTRRTANAGAEELERFRNRLDRGWRDARKSMSRRMHEADRYVHGHPWTMLAVAAGVGAIAGLAAARMMRHHDE